MPPRHFLDRSRLPAAVFREEALDHLDQLVEDLRSRLTKEISVQDAALRASSLARALSQTYLHRCVEQGDAAASLCGSRSWLSAMIIARALLETIAAYSHGARKLSEAVSTGNLRTIQDALLASAFSTRLKDLRDIANDPVVQAKNILTQVDALRAHRPSVREDYDYLSEFAHPNALGTFLFFGQLDRDRGVVELNQEGWMGEQALKWVGTACFTLHAAIDAADEMERLAQELSALQRPLSS